MYEVTYKYDNKKYKVIFRVSGFDDLLNMINEFIVGDVEKIVKIND